MAYYPVCLQVAGRRCVVIGGGEVAERKVEALLAAGAQVTVVSPSLTPTLAEQAERGAIEHVARRYQPGDLAGALLAFAATDDETLHASIARDAEQAGVLLNVVDRPAWCTFIVPAVLRRGELSVAVSTGGGSPALARRVRDEIGRVFGPEYGRALEVLAGLRRHLRAQALSGADRRRILLRLAASDLVARLRSGDAAAVDRLLAEHAGRGVSLAALGLRPGG